ncbi:MAG: nickel-dependent lactate racemase [Chloroflexi bacterium]|nr:nickel-dependent lactate racemase [Chloroflexota bacterium]
MVKLAYGRTTLQAQLPDNWRVDIINPPVVSGCPNPAEEIQRALEDPLEGFSFDRFIGAKSVAIAVNDKTRPVPHDLLLPPLLKKLESCGILPSQVHLIIASGTHVPMKAAEYPAILPPSVLESCRVSSHDCDDIQNLVRLGVTLAGTPVLANRHFMSADRRIVIGNIEPHHFMGFSGGAKSAAIGLTSRETINANHKMLLHPDARMGLYEENPMRRDVEDIGDLMDIDLALNIIMNDQRQIVHALAGTPRAVMRYGVPLSREVCQVRVSQQYDVVIASAGGYPKDINLYQAQKALTHAAQIARPGGTIILVTACEEGAGSDSYVRTMRGMHTWQDVFEQFRQTGFSVGPHKALQFAREGIRFNMILVSDMPQQQVKELLLTPAQSLAEAVAIIQLESPLVAVLPKATNTIPVFPT